LSAQLSLIETVNAEPARDWLLPGKCAAICFSMDDVYPGCDFQHGDGGEDQRNRPLNHLQWLLGRHEELRVTLFVTPDWRQTSPIPTRKLVSRTPLLKSRLHLAKTLRPGVMRLSSHPKFLTRLQKLPRIEIGLHGLHHLKRGPGKPTEFAGLSSAQCVRVLRESISIFEEAGLDYVRGMTPPGWDVTPELLTAMIKVGLQFVASARDIRTRITSTATTEMSGLRGASLIYPQHLCGEKLLHISTNFQATNAIDRAIEIIEQGGLVAVKAHSLKKVGGHVALDGLDELYRNYLDLLFTRLEDKYGSSLWWTTMGEMSNRCMAQRMKSLSTEAES
jgi:hypothetical protein